MGSVPKTTNQFFQFAIHLIYAIVVAHGFSLSTSVFIPITKMLESEADAFNAGALAFAFFITVSSWVGYSRSIFTMGYSNSRFGVLRFVTDLFILFFYYLLFTLVSPDYYSNYPQTFLLLVLIFFAYLSWDTLKHKDAIQKKSKLTKRIFQRADITTWYFLGFVLLFIAYLSVTSNISSIPMLNTIHINSIFLAVAVVFMTGYRLRKWKPTVRRRKRKTNSD